MDAHEVRREFLRERLERLVDQALAAAMLHRHVLLIGDEIVDVCDRNETQLLAEARADLLAPMLDACGFRDLHQPARRDARGMPQSVRELFLAYRLEQVTEIGRASCRERVFITV